MPKQQKINGKDCRYYVDGSMWSCFDGKSFFCKSTAGTMDQLAVVKDSLGMKVINGRWNIAVSSAIAVATCFVKRPNDGKRYMVAFNDGNIYNCYYKNLSWVPYHYQHTKTSTIDLALINSMCTVNKSGDITVDGNSTFPLYYWKSQTPGMLHVGEPFVYVKAGDGVHSLRVNIDEIMRDAGFIQGDDAGMSAPVILHRDGDWLNFAKDNLEWCESTDPRYISFSKNKRAEKEKIYKKKNPGKPILPNLIS